MNSKNFFELGEFVQSHLHQGSDLYCSVKRHVERYAYHGTCSGDDFVNSPGNMLKLILTSQFDVSTIY